MYDSFLSMRNLIFGKCIYIVAQAFVALGETEHDQDSLFIKPFNKKDQKKWERKEMGGMDN